ncbi:MAG: ABC transporter substrate-binding protein [Bacteroidetes bacterium]|nr:ABC transporter substrate-binding protein [Bacteroidota bacterium]
MKIINCFGFIFLLLVGILFFNSCENSKKETLKIGGLLPMTGAGSLYGQFAKEGMQIAVDEINSEGGINGQQIEIVIEDNQSNANSGVSAFQSLIQKGVKVALTEFSPVVVACSPIANQTKTILLNCGAQSPKIRDGGPYVFSIIIDANVEAENMAKFLFDSLKISNVGTYVINTETGINTEKVFSKAYQELGGRILLREVHEQSATDFRSTLSKLKNKYPKAVYLVSLVKESAQILKQSYEIGFKTQWLSYASFQGPDILAVGKAAEGVIYSYPLFDTSSVKAKNFRKKYFQKYSREPEVYASTFYDGINIISAAFASGKFNGEDIQHYLKKISFDGVTGKTEFKEGNWVDKPVDFRTVKNGKFVKY